MDISQIGIIIILYYADPPSYIHTISECKTIIIDNTPNRDLKISNDNISYVPLRRNTGIANALNIGMNKAISEGLKWVVTMDQDSMLPSNLISDYLDYLNQCEGDIGIISPLINMYDGENKQPTQSTVEIKEAITSGSMISVDAYLSTNGFKTEMFIDCVDFEFCWNVRRHGYKIIQINSVVMQHHLGDTKDYKIGKKHLFYITNHNAIRRYYMVRNLYYMYKLYPEYRPSKFYIIISLLISILKIISFENDKIQKLKSIYKGFIDYRKNIMGENPHQIYNNKSNNINIDLNGSRRDKD